MRPLLLSLSHLDFPRNNLSLPLPPLSPRGALGFGVEITGIWIPGGEFFPSHSLLSLFLPLPSSSPARAPAPPRRRGSPLPAPARRRPSRPLPSAVRRPCPSPSPRDSAPRPGPLRGGARPGSGAARPCSLPRGGLATGAAPDTVQPRRGPGAPPAWSSAPARRPGPGATRVAPFTP
jgi:hypothetical protein